MVTSFETTKSALLQALKEADNKVVALTGKWGTGKTYMWDKTAEIDSELSKSSMRVSALKRIA